MQPEKIVKLVKEGGITNDKDLALFTVADEIITKLDTLSEAQNGVIKAIKEIPQADMPEFSTASIEKQNDIIVNELKAIKNEINKPCTITLKLK